MRNTVYNDTLIERTLSEAHYAIDRVVTSLVGCVRGVCLNSMSEAYSYY